MTELTLTRTGGRRGHGALGLALVSLILFIGGGFLVGGVFWVLGAVAGVAAIALAVIARRDGAGRESTVAIVLAAVTVVWFALYMIVAALD